MEQVGGHEDRAAGEGTPPAQRILSMNLHGTTTTSVGTVLRQRIEELAQAIREKNIGLLMTFYAPDVVAFDLRPPRDVRGADAYRQNFEHWFGSFEGPLGFDHVELTITPGEGAAFCHYLALVSGTRTDGRKSGYWARGTTCFEERGGKWLVTHEHISMPAAV
jgi:ketosteroid isomerase-like protein